MPEQGFTHPDAAPLADVGARLQPISAEDHDGGSMTEMAHFIPLAERSPAGDPGRAAIAEIEPDVEELEVDARHQDRRHGHQDDRLSGALETQRHHRPLVLAIEPLD